MSGTLFVVATPIGNLDDLTPRARQALGDVSLIAAEDTRHTGRLLMSIGVKSRLIALHDHNEEQVLGKLIRTLQEGESVALVSDAGTPLVSDPGFRLVREAHRSGITVSPIPGASAVTAALSAAGIPTDRFCFEGFLPSKRLARRTALLSLVSEPRTLVFYESVHRISESLADMTSAFGADRWAALVAARHMAPNGAVVVDCGTTITVDAVDHTGQHLGGVIVPGIWLMRQSLAEGTGRIGRVGDGTIDVMSRDTSGAVATGTVLAAAAAVDRIVGEYQKRLGEEARTLITGDEADLVMSRSSTAFEKWQDLVLRGLWIAAERAM